MFAPRLFAGVITRVIGCQSHVLRMTLALSHERATASSGLLGCVSQCEQQRRGLGKKVDVKEKKGSKGSTKPKVLLRDDELAEVIDIEHLRLSLQEVYDKLKGDYVRNLNVRSGVGIEALEVEFEKEMHPLKELASISKKGSNLLVLNFAALPEAIKPVEDAIMKSGMNVNPQQEGTVLYITLPKVTREHRETLAKNAKTLFNKAKDDLSKILNVYQKETKRKTSVGVSADLSFNVSENVKYIVDGFAGECESLLHSKTKELLGE